MKGLIAMVFMFSSVLIFAQNTEYTNMEREVSKLDENYYEIKSVHENGVVSELGFVLNGKKTGEWNSYDTQGNITAIGQFAKDKKHGKWITYDIDNNVQYFAYYRKGKLVSLFDVQNLAYMVD